MNVKFLAMLLDQYLSDPESRAKNPLPLASNPLLFVVRMHELPAKTLVCPCDNIISNGSVISSLEDGSSSYATWDTESLLLLWDKVQLYHSDLPLVWEKRGNHGGKHMVATCFGTVQALDTKDLDKLLVKAKALMEQARQNRQ